MDYQDTSREAWDGFKPVSGSLDDQILMVIGQEAAVTCQEIEEITGRSHQSVSGNLRHLVERFLVRNSGQYGLTQSGRRAIKWELTEAGRACVDLMPEAA